MTKIERFSDLEKYVLKVLENNLQPQNLIILYLN